MVLALVMGVGMGAMTLPGLAQQRRSKKSEISRRRNRDIQNLQKSWSHSNSMYDQLVSAAWWPQPHHLL